MRRYRLAVLGGTFDHLHVGHHALLATAFSAGNEVAIGLTTDRFVSQHPKPGPDRIGPFRLRRAALVRWLRRNYPRRKWRVVPLDDPFGRSVEPDVDALVVSQETLAGGRAVNRERRRRGHRPVPLVVVPLALADDLEPVSSRRIRSGVLEPDGSRRGPIRLSVDVADPRDRRSVDRALRRVFPRASITRGGSSTRGAAAKVDLRIRVGRNPTGSGWVALERSRRIQLRPALLEGSTPDDLEAGLVTLLHPPLKRKLFGTPRTSRR